MYNNLLKKITFTYTYIIVCAYMSQTSTNVHLKMTLSNSRGMFSAVSRTCRSGEATAARRAQRTRDNKTTFHQLLRRNTETIY